MRAYDHRTIDAKWQERWESAKLHEARDGDARRKFFALVEFPYPSGEGLHVGHLRSYTAMDVIARKRRMEWWNVLYPIGWDAFGLPAENYALKTGQHPRITTEKNCANFRRQLRAAGFSFDWSREVDTADPAYYRWTQWIFLQLLDRGLAYKAKQPINWCINCKIGLANEEVVGGVCERCGGPVAQREKEQWMLKITAYAEQLLAGLDDVDYIERAKVQQRNWIGRSEGVDIDFAVQGSDAVVTVFTTRCDTIFSCAFLALAPEHPLLAALTTEPQRADVEAYVDRARRTSVIDRTNVERAQDGMFTGSYAVNPMNGEAVPIWVADFVLGTYGHGAVFGDIHDERDFRLGKRYGIPLRVTVLPASGEHIDAIRAQTRCSPDDGVLIDSGPFTGMTSAEARERIAQWLEERHVGRRRVHYKLRDWVFSRQRYWGEPIPVVFCATCGTVPVPEDQLPVLLPEVERYQPTDTGESPLATIVEWVHTTCPRCDGPARRETDVMPNWAGSSWYFLRYCDPHNDAALADRTRLAQWMPVDWYNGGMEHTTLHLLYSRFWNQFLHDIGSVPVREPYAKRTSHGLILAEDGEKMSKSRGNVVNPDGIIADYGADAVRVYEMFIGPFDQPVPWSTNGLVGCRRFLERVASLIERVDPKVGDGCAPPEERDLARLLHQTIQKVTTDIEVMHFNTAISALMEYTNTLAKREHIPFVAYVTLLALLAPFAPHLMEELHAQLPDLQATAHSVFTHPWPTHDPALAVEDEVTLVVQVNGKVRATLRVPAAITDQEARVLALQDPAVVRHLSGRVPKKVFFVARKLVNFVV